MSEEPRRNAYQWVLRRLLDQYRATGKVGDETPRDAKHALQLAKKAAQRKVRRE